MEIENQIQIIKFSGGLKYIDDNKLLIEACKLGNEIIVKRLISVRIPLYICDKYGCGPIYYASRFNHISILKLLVEAGSPLQATTKMNRTALQIAAYHGHVACVEYFMELKVDVNATDNIGMTALHWAAENGHELIVKLLLDAGAVQTKPNKFGKSPQELALLKNHTRIFVLLQDINESKLSPVSAILPMRNVHLSGKSCMTRFIRDSSLPFCFSELKDRLLGKYLSNHTTSRHGTIKLLEEHGIKLLPVDESTLVANALKRGQKAVLTDAGKLALQKIVSNPVANIFNQSNNYSPSGVNKYCKRNTCRTAGIQLGIASKKPIVFNSTKSFGQKSLVNHQHKTSTATMMTHSDHVKLVFTNDFESTRRLTYETKKEYLISLKNELEMKSKMVVNLRNQLKSSMNLIQKLKIKYDAKERKALLYKRQLLNITKIIKLKNQVNYV